MATSNDPFPAMTEDCENCDRPTPHHVEVRILRESNSGENVAYSREPYRISECTICGQERTIRMNDK